jgi:OOP family OmpA-OmpF porin
MKTILFAAAASVVAFTALPAAAQGLSGIYVQGNLGYSFAGTSDTTAVITLEDETETISGDVDLDGAVMGSAAVGASLADGLRVEAELLYTKNDLSGSEDFEEVAVSQLAVMANVLYDFAVGGVSPYVGAGVGFGTTNLEIEEGDLDDSGLAWQLRGGVSFGEGVIWDIGYRYVNMADFEASFVEEDEGDEIGINLQAEAAVHAVTVGVRIPLGG